MQAKVIWKKGLSFDATADSGFQVSLGGDPTVGGENDGFRPMEFIAMGLAGCTAMDVISILSKKRQQVSNFEVQVHADRADSHPKVFTHAVIEYLISGQNIDETAVLRAIELSATIYCPAQAMLGQIMPIDIKYTIFEDKGAGQREQTAAGVFTPSLKGS